MLWVLDTHPIHRQYIPMNKDYTLTNNLIGDYMTQITLNKGGKAEQIIDSSQIDVPDLWHLALSLWDAGNKIGSRAVLECWHLAHSLKQHIQESK